jgi:hypothetical protein
MNKEGKLNIGIYNLSQKIKQYWYNTYHLCGVVVRVPGYRSKGPGSILGATKFSEK